MRLRDVLLTGATETQFSPKIDHSVEVNCKEKYNFFLFFIRKSSPIKLQNNRVLLFNPFNPKLIMQILPTIQEEND